MQKVNRSREGRAEPDNPGRRPAIKACYQGCLLSTDDRAEEKQNNQESSTEIAVFPAILALSLLALDVILSISYYRNQDVYDLRWLLALLDLSVLLAVYAMLGRRVGKLLVSMKLALTLLFVLAILSIIGTYLPQGDTVLGTTWVDNPLYDFYRHLGLFDMYYSRWFLLIMFLLIFNLSVCIYRRIPKTWKQARHPRVDVKDKFISSQPVSASIEGIAGRGAEAARAVLKGHRYHVHSGDSSSLGEKGRFTGLFSIAFHLSFLLIGIGAILMSFLGWEEQLYIPDGATVKLDHADLEVTNHGFDIDYKEMRDGDRVLGYAPTLYATDLEVFKDGQSVASKRIEVNSPLRYEGINFHQSSYDRTDRGYVTILTVTSKPGKSLIYLGFFAMMGGVVFMLYFPHRRIWFMETESGTLLMGGRANRSKVTFQRDFDRIISELRFSLGQEASKDGPS